MLKSNAPTQLTVAFASGSGAGPINAIPIPASSTAGAASWTTGFTLVNMEPIGSGGIPPFGADFNGLFNALSNAQIWEQAGYLYPYSSAFSTAVGGYPAGASLQMASGLGLWLNQADSNTTNPDSTASANWVEMCANAGTSSIALSGSSVTPTANQLGARLLVLTGALSAPCKLVLPLRAGAGWKILNNTTGGQTVTVGGATGATVTIAAGSAGAQEVFSDGTNYYTTAFNGAGVYLPINGNAVSASAWANARTIAMTGDVAWSVSVDGSANVTAAGTIAASAVTLAKMANLTGSTLLGNPTGTAVAPSAITLGAGLQFSSSQLQLVPTSAQVVGWLGYSPVQSFNTRTGTVTLAGSDITALGNVQFGGSIGIGTNPASVPSVGNPIVGANNVVAYNAGNIAMQLITDNASARTQQYSFGAAGVAAFDAGMTYNTSTRLLSLATNSGTSQVYVDVSGNVGIGTVPTSVPSIGNPTSGAHNLIAYNAGNIALILLTDNASARTSSIGFGSQGIGTFDAGMSYSNSTRSLSFATGSAAHAVLDASGNFSVTGTVTNSTSDERLKTNFVEREPQPIHRTWWGDYDRTDSGDHGIGHRAQEVQATHPHRVHTVQGLYLPGTEEPMLLLDRLGLAEEQGIWNGRQIDALLDRMAALEGRAAGMN